MYVIASQHSHRALSQAVVGNYAEERAVHTQVGQSQGDIRFTSSVTGFKIAGHTNLLVVWRGQTKHDLTDGKKFLRTFIVLQ